MQKIKKPNDEESEEEPDEFISQIIIGDLAVSSKQGLPICKRTIKKLLSDKQVKNYLGIYGRKKLLTSIPSYID
jgi:hypothetical protein